MASLALEVATVVSPTVRARLEAAVGADCRAYHVGSVIDALRCVRERPVRAVLVSPHLVARDQLPAVASLVRGFPGVPTLAVMASREDSGSSQRLLELGAIGVRRVIDLNAREGWHRLRAMVSDPASLAGARILQDLLAALSEEATTETRRFFEIVVRAAPGVTTVRHLSRLIGAAPSTFMSRFFRARLPSPKRYLAAIRLAYAAALLEEPGRSVADVAYRLEYSSPQSFGRHVRLVLGITATAFRDHYGFGRAMHDFVVTLIVPYRSVFNSFRPLNLGTGDPGQPS